MNTENKISNENKASEGILPLIQSINDHSEEIRALKQRINDCDLYETAQIYLIETLGYTQLQAQEVVDGLKKGLEDYAAKRKEAEENETCLETNIKDALSGYPADERMTILVNILTALQANSPSIADNIESLRNANSSLPEEDLIKDIVNALDGLPFASVVEAVGKEIDQSTMAQLDSLREMMTDEYKLAAALHLYIAQQQGTLNAGDDECRLPPEMIGAMTGASIDALIATDDLKNNRIDLKMWQRIIKYILGAVLLVSICLLTAVAMLGISLPILYLTGVLFGGGTLSLIIGSLLLIVPCMYINGLHDSLLDYSSEKLSGVYDRVMVRLTEMTKNFKAKVKAYLSKNKAVADENATDTRSETADTNKQENDRALTDDSNLTPSLA